VIQRHERFREDIVSDPRIQPSGARPASDGPSSSLDFGLTAVGGTDVRDIEMNRLESGPSATNPDVLRITGSVPGTATRQPDGSWAFVPDPTTLPPGSPFGPTGLARPVTSVAGKSFFHTPGGLLVGAMATLATVAIVGVAINSGPTDREPTRGTLPVAATAMPILRTPNATSGETPLQTTGVSGAAEANAIVTEIVRGCLSEVDQADLGLVFEAVPGADLDRVYQAVPDHPDHLFMVDRLVDAEVFTVTVTATGSSDHRGAKGQWAVDITSGGVVPLLPLSMDGSPAMWSILISHGCGTIQKMM
jgi:hypothetical protein